MATKKKAAKKKGPGKLDVGSDPPILVGGGGSSYIWVNFGEGQTPAPPHGLPPTAPTPHTPASYSVNKITNSPVRLYFNNGVTPGPAGEQPLDIGPGAARNQWYIRFAVPGPPKRRRKAAKK